MRRRISRRARNDRIGKDREEVFHHEGREEHEVKSEEEKDT